MGKIFCFLVFTFTINNQLRSQILPKEGSKLNYRLIGFSFPPAQNANNVILEIADGNYTTEDSFKKHIIQSLYSKNNKIVAEVPSFGRQYTWRIYVDNKINTTIINSELHHFSTDYTTEVDTNYRRLRITKKAEKYKDAYIFLDGTRTLYDMDGHPVWFLPNAERFNSPVSTPMPVAKNIVMGRTGPFVPANDLKLTPQGTITFVFYETAYEVNYGGDILWKAPDEDKLKGENREFYHHEFTRLANGHYMALKNDLEDVYWTWKHNSSTDSSLEIVPDNDVRTTTGKVFPRKTEFAVIKEYDVKGNVVWSWKSSTYFIDQNKGKDLKYCMSANDRDHQEVHANSLYFDESTKTLYLGFRNISKILKLQYPSGKVLNSYSGDDIFCYQHSCRKSAKGYLYLFNNNLCNPGKMPEVETLQEPLSDKGNLKLQWKYECTYESTFKKHGEDHGFTKGGNVMELPDGSMFVNMGSDHSKIFIAGKDKKILWSALPERLDEGDRTWENILEYKASIVLNRKEMERLVWNGENADSNSK